jgi:hypothetical protein
MGSDHDSITEEAAGVPGRPARGVRVAGAFAAVGLVAVVAIAVGGPAAWLGGVIAVVLPGVALSRLASTDVFERYERPALAFGLSALTFVLGGLVLHLLGVELGRWSFVALSIAVTAGAVALSWRRPVTDPQWRPTMPAASTLAAVAITGVLMVIGSLIAYQSAVEYQPASATQLWQLPDPQNPARVTVGLRSHETETTTFTVTFEGADGYRYVEDVTLEPGREYRRDLDTGTAQPVRTTARSTDGTVQRQVWSEPPAGW